MSRGLAARLFVILVTVTVIASSAPPASASHRALYDDFVGQNVFGGAGNSPEGTPNVRDDGLRTTYEPDYESTERWTPGAAIDNCIADLDESWDGSLPASVDLDPSHAFAGQCDSGAVPGDLGAGELFLDVQVVTHEAGPVANEYFAASHYWRTITGDSRNVILPGRNGVTAWFGHWNDKNADGRIDDVCGWDTRPERRAIDEFLWRGQATGENGGDWKTPTPPYKFVMYAWMDPGSYAMNPAPFQDVPSIPPTGPSTSQNYDQRLDDRTGEDDKDGTTCPSNTGWISQNGYQFYNYQTSLVWTLTMATAVNPGGTSSSTNPSAQGLLTAAFVDVDIYQTLNPQVEELSYGLLEAPFEAIDLVFDVVDAGVDAACGEVNNQTGRDFCADADGETCGLVNETAGANPCKVNAVAVACQALNETSGGYGWCQDPIDESCRFLVDNAADACSVDPITPACDLVMGPAGYDLCADPAKPVDDAANAHDDDQSRLSRTVSPAYPHEPNTPFDSYPGASYGGTSYAAGGTDGFPACASDSPGQPRGSCNDYVLLADADNDPNTPNVATGYTGDWHAWIDSTPIVHYPAFMRPYVIPPAVGLLVGGGFSLDNHPAVYAGGNSHGQYNDQQYLAGSEYQWAAWIGQWRDSNGDTWIGSARDSDAPYGNATFIDPAGSGDFYDFEPNNYQSSEWKGLCGLTGRVLDITVKLVPSAGSWGNGVIVRWEYMEPGKPTSGDNPGHAYADLVLSGEIVLNNGCPFLGNPRAVTSDKIVFLGGNAQIDFEVVTTATIVVDRFPTLGDPNMPGRFATETVMDVDVYSVAN